MPRKRDYAAEYARRIAKGLAQGKTRAQARGHGADVKGAKPQVIKISGAMSIPGKLKSLRADRNVIILADTESGRKVRIAAGKAGRLRELWTEDDAEGGGFEWDRGYRGDDKIVRIQIHYS